MPNRIMGVNSGIDVDTVVKQSLSTEQNKIDKAYQQQKIYEYQQEQLKEIVNQAQDFYDKYLDILSGDSLLKGTAYETAKFTGIDSNGNLSTAVTAKGYAGVDVTDYDVTVTQLAAKASATINTKNLNAGDEININGVIISVEKKENSDAPDFEKTVKALNAKLKTEGINVTAKYSTIAGGIVIESGDMGKDSSFQLKVPDAVLSEEDKNKVNSDGFIEYKGQNAEGTIKKGEYVYQIDQSKNTFIIDNIEFTLNSTTASTIESTNPSDKVIALKETDAGVTTTIKSDDKTTLIDGNTTTITSGNTVTKLETKEGGINTTTTIKIDGVVVEISSGANNINEAKVVSGNLEADFSAETYPSTSDDGITTTKDENGVLTATKDLGNGITINTIFKPIEGKEGEYDKVTNVVDYSKFEHLSAHTDEEKKKATISIESENGRKNTVITADGTKITTELQNDGSIKETKEVLNTNGVGYDLVSTTTTSGAITLSGETDISNLKDTIVNFVNDYNKLMENINAKLWETRDKDYMPLTDEQKAEMSESEIEAWEKKASTGLLRNDTDLKRIQSAMKSAMSTMMSSTGLTLESIGIEPIDNYTTKNGMYKIDEDKLTKALQNNAEEVKDLFTSGSYETTNKKGETVTHPGGVLTQLQSILKNEFKTSRSSLSKRVGFEGTSTESTNTLTKNISKQNTLIKELKAKYTTKETALYKKYSNLEVMLEKLNAQTSSLYSMLGIS